ncbi:uncharacterized protein LOC125031817 [Penaeus chinensis]|uniref:uncharacterized protein LOC125031817 n=1 Tax=Penaeus chinensis TaxID=139456 RepID=UPI001FB80093|nr:uncharacterized protein LOC125031817 [Penaeus chinensis]
MSGMDHHFDTCPNPSVCPLHGYASWSSGTFTQEDVLMGGRGAAASTADSYEHDTASVSRMPSMDAGAGSATVSPILRSLLQPDQGSALEGRHDTVSLQCGSRPEPHHAVRNRHDSVMWGGTMIGEEEMMMGSGHPLAYGSSGYMPEASGVLSQMSSGHCGYIAGQPLAPQQPIISPEAVRHLSGLSTGIGATGAGDGGAQLPQDLYQMMSSLTTRPDHRSSLPSEAAVANPLFSTQEPDLLDLDSIRRDDLIGAVAAVDLPSSESDEFASFSDHLLSDLDTAQDPQVPCGPQDQPFDQTRAGPSSDRGTQAVKPRRRRPRIPYESLTEDEKYVHIRDINNEASRTYRRKHRQSVTNLQAEEKVLLETNRALRVKEKALRDLKTHMQSLEGIVKQKTLEPRNPDK